MRKVTLVGASIIVFLLLVLVAGLRVLELRARPASPSWSAAPPSTPSSATETEAAREADQGFLYGRITTVDGATLEGRLRFGGAEEAFWSNHFNGSKEKNPWGAQAPIERLPKVHDPITIFGFELVDRVLPPDLRRPFMARFGDITRIEARGKEVRVTLKSGTVVVVNRWGASDFDDGVRVWDRTRGVVDLDSLRIHTIEFLPTPALGEVPSRLHGTVRTRLGEFTGFIQWNRTECVGTDEFRGRAASAVDDQIAEGEVRLRFDSIRSIARHSRDSALVTLLDGRELVISGAHVIGDGNRPGVNVDDPRYGGVLIPWEVLERLDFTPGGSGPAYGAFPPGHPLTGTVITRAGERLAGRLVYDLDESETNETLDAPYQGVNYNIPFGLIASIVLTDGGDRETEHVTLTLHDGEKLQLERSGDLAETNTGLLIFVDGHERPDFVAWTGLAQVDFDQPTAIYPPLGGR